MKTKTIISVMTILAAVLLVSCTKESVIDRIENEECLNSAQASVDDFLFDHATRAAVSNVGAFSWTRTKDLIGVWPTLEPGEEEIASQVQFKATSVNGASAIFSGSGWGLMPNRKYYAYYPYKSGVKANLFSGNYGISATQTANNNTSHLSTNIIMYTSGTAPASKDTAKFQFHHLGSIMKFDITIPEDNKDNVFKQVTVSSADSLFTRGFTFNPCADVPTVTATSAVNELTLKLGSNGAGFKPVDGKISVWFLIGPVDLSGKSLTISVQDGYGSYSGSVQGIDQKSGLAHLYEVSVSAGGGELDYKDLTVDLGLPSGILWAKSNLTKNGLPLDETSIGDFYGWGELEPYYSSITINSESSVNYTWKSGYTGYVQASYNKAGTIKGTYTSNTAQLGREDDAASVKLGENWRMPSIADFDELAANCTFTGTTVNGVAGTLATSNKNGNTVFFPATGYIDGTTMKGYTSGSAGARFWLTDCESATQARQQYFSNSSPAKEYASPKDKWRGTPVRPIYVPAK